jgi:hypothetical protein
MLSGINFSLSFSPLPFYNVCKAFKEQLLQQKYLLSLYDNKSWDRKFLKAVIRYTFFQPWQVKITPATAAEPNFLHFTSHPPHFPLQL